MGFIIGKTSASNFLSKNVTALNSQSNNAQAEPIFNTQSNIELDLEKAIEDHKSLSLAYQLMRAIAHENEISQNNSKIHQSTKDSHEFTLDIQYEVANNFSLTQTSVSTDLQDQFSVSFELSSLMTFDLSLTNANNNEIEISFIQQNQSSSSITLESSTTEVSDPLILNLDNTDFSFTPGQSISFDLNADGHFDKISNLNSGNSFLAYDKNNNGTIDDGSELFGDTRGAADGFDDLRNYDLNDDNQINAQDKIFESLLLLNFDSQGHQTTRTLSSEEITSLSLNIKQNNQLYQNDNLLVSESSFKRSDDSLGRVGDFLLSMS